MMTKANLVLAGIWEETLTSPFPSQPANPPLPQPSSAPREAAEISSRAENSESKTRVSVLTWSHSGRPRGTWVGELSSRPGAQASCPKVRDWQGRKEALREHPSQPSPVPDGNRKPRSEGTSAQPEAIRAGPGLESKQEEKSASLILSLFNMAHCFPHGLFFALILVLKILHEIKY